MTLWRFPFGRTFPPADPVGHFVIALAAAMNDLLLTNKTLFPPDYPEREDRTPAERLALLRQAIGQVWETHLLVQEASRIPEVDAFIDRFAAAYSGEKLDAYALVDALRGRGGATAPATRNVLRLTRHSTFHYPKPGDADLRQALVALARDGETAEIEHGDSMVTLRATFADEVLLRMGLTEPVAQDRARLEALFRDLSESVVPSSTSRRQRSTSGSVTWLATN